MNIQNFSQRYCNLLSNNAYCTKLSFLPNMIMFVQNYIYHIGCHSDTNITRTVRVSLFAFIFILRYLEQRLGKNIIQYSLRNRLLDYKAVLQAYYVKNVFTECLPLSFKSYLTLIYLIWWYFRKLFSHRGAVRVMEEQKKS